MIGTAGDWLGVPMMQAREQPEYVAFIDSFVE
jgi:hypothetical protein